MNADRWRRVDKIFHDLIGLTPEERAPFLERLCSDDPLLKKEVEELIQSHERSGSFLDSQASVPASGSWIGRALGSYEVKALLGSGGMGEVWKARDTKLGREVAIKALPVKFSEDTDRLARFEREARLLASVNHPNIATIHGLEESGGMRFLVLELVEGDTLADRVARGAIPAEQALRLALQVAQALEAAHEKSVVHRDLKPANIKVTPDGRVKVLDFGLAKLLTPDEPATNLSNSPTIGCVRDTAGSHSGNRGIHGARAGARPERRQTSRHLGVRMRSLRVTDRARGFQR